MFSSGTRRLSQAPPPNVNLYCTQCSSQIGIFDNEWIRVTPTYARAKEKGTHFGTEIGQKTQIVPVGISRKAIEGCSMAEVFCRKCSSGVGQYCKATLDKEKQHLIDTYFFKLSRVYLKDAQTSYKVDPVFGYSGEIIQPPRPSATPRPMHQANARWSQTPVQLPVERYSASNLFAPTPDIHADNLITERLAQLERQVTDLASVPSRNSPNSTLTMSNLNRSQADNGAILSEQKKMMTEQKNNFAMLRNQIESFTSTVDSLQASLCAIQSDSRPAGLASSDVATPASNSEAMKQALQDAQSNAKELKALREENQRLKARFSTIASAMGLQTGDLAAASTETTSEQPRGDVNVLGKRKRESHHDKPTILRAPELVSSRESHLRQSLESENQMPTPLSSAQSNGDGELSPFEPPRVHFSDWTSQSQQQNENHNTSTEHDSQLPPNLANSTIEPPDSQNVQEPDLAVAGPIDFSDDDAMVQNGEPKKVVLEEAPRLDRTRATSSASSYRETSERPSSEAAIEDESARPPTRRRRRVTEPVKSHKVRSVAPSANPSTGIARRRRTLAGRIPKNGGIDNATVVTPDDFSGLLDGRSRFKETKERLQTTEKLLNHELGELGLTEWIGKDKRSSVYRAAVDAARARQREAKKLEAFASRGFQVKPALKEATGGMSEKVISPNLPISPARVDTPLPEPANTQAKSIPTIEPEKTDPTIPTDRMLTRRQQREEEIRKRDQMAQEAMEREERV